MPEIPDVAPGQPVASDWGNDIRDRTLQRYQDAAERDALMPFPAPGDLAYLEDTGEVTVFTAAGWRQFLVLTPTRAQVPAGLTVENAPAGGLLQRWQGDGPNWPGNRAYDWRRSASFGMLELWALGSTGGEVKVLTIMDSAVNIDVSILRLGGSLPNTAIVNQGNRLSFLADGTDNWLRMWLTGSTRVLESPAVRDLTTSSAPNVNIGVENAQFRRSTAVVATVGDENEPAARDSLQSRLDGADPADLLAVIDHLLDRIETLEGHHA